MTPTVAFYLFIVNAASVPLDLPSANPAALAPASVGIAAIPFTSEASCALARDWVRKNLRRAAVCLRQ